MKERKRNCILLIIFNVYIVLLVIIRFIIFCFRIVCFFIENGILFVFYLLFFIIIDIVIKIRRVIIGKLVYYLFFVYSRKKYVLECFLIFDICILN